MAGIRVLLCSMGMLLRDHRAMAACEAAERCLGIC
jgi:hypothetical protein